MAYLRQEKETVEIDYSLDRVWEAISKVISFLQWRVEQSDDEAHRIKVKTKSSFLSYSSVLVVEAVSMSEETCRVTVKAETPVTTITAMADFGRSRDRINAFLEELAKQLNSSENA